MRNNQAILFLIDTQGANVVGCYGGGVALGTPNIDALAAEGCRFDRAHTAQPVCGPARSAIFTGAYPHSSGAFGNAMEPAQGFPTLGQRLQKAGVRTAYIGKWHLDGHDYFGTGHCPDGWDPDYWFDGKNYLDSLPDDRARDLSRRELTPEEVAEFGITSEFTHAHRIADRAVDFLEKHRDEDFLLVVSIDEPHGPFIAPEPYAGAFADFQFPIPNDAAADDLSTKPRQQREWAEKTSWVHKLIRQTPDGAALCMPRYFGCNSYSDSQTGRVLDAMRAHVPDALTIYTSDHGDMLGSHGLASKGPAMYEEITRVPFIVRWPGVVPAGTSSQGLVSHVDLVPTLLEVFGVDAPPLLHGKSLLPQWKSPEIAVNERVFIEFGRFEVDHDGHGAFAPIRCCLEGNHKLAVNLLDTDEFYDLARDPGEIINRIDDPQTAADRDRLHDALLDWMNRTRDPFRGPHWGRRAWCDAGWSSWIAGTRPRPLDPAFRPPTRLYATGRESDHDFYP